MWANGSPAYYSGLAWAPSTAPLLRDRPSKNVDNNVPSASQHDQPSPNKGNNVGLVELYLSAVEGPPSAESLRQLNTEMRLAANLRRGQGHKVGSSASSITSFTGELDHALRDIDSVRRSSYTSIENSNASKDAADGFQTLGKNLFHRRVRSKQESNSSDSSLYSADAPIDVSTGTRESVLPKLFARRKLSRDEPAAVQKRLRISEPFNFQHVAHTNREAADGAMALDEDQQRISQPKSRPRARTASDYAYTNILPETVAEHGELADIPPSRPGLISRHTGSFQTMRRLMKPGKMAELSVPATTTTQPNRQPPKRPPRSPLQFDALPPTPPPRVSSRQMLYPVSIDTAASYPMERPLTSSGFQHPQPFSPPSPVDQLPTPTRQAFTPPADLSTFCEQSQGLLGRPRAGTPEPSWPLASPTVVDFETQLPDLGDDEGNPRWTTRPNATHNGANAPIRGSKSVPMLRKLLAEQSAQGVDQPQTATDVWATQVKAELEDSLGGSLTLDRASWEDDIDYCYDHEAEADCDYRWERPSMDITPGKMMYQAPPSASPLDEALTKSNGTRSPGMLSASGFEVPALSPSSQTSAVLGHEAVTPITDHADSAMTHSSWEKKHDVPAILKDGTCQSVVPCPLEASEFQFSPSLLVPQEYRRNSPTTAPELSETGKHGLLATLNQREDGYVAMAAHGDLSSSRQRSSTATTGSNYTSSTNTSRDSVGERHTSTNSSWTALTRHTASISSLNKIAMTWIEDAGPVPTSSRAQSSIEEEETTPPASEDVVPELTMDLSPSGGKRAMHKSHASDSVIGNSLIAKDSQQLPKARHSRARTASLSQAPPAGQYALFPRTAARSHVEKI